MGSHQDDSGLPMITLVQELLGDGRRGEACKLLEAARFEDTWNYWEYDNELVRIRNLADDPPPYQPLDLILPGSVPGASRLWR